jgi:non-ribosomal peptide synthetase component F
MFMVFLGGFVATLSRCTRQTDMLVGTQVAGRTHAELDPIVGMFTNTVALRMTLPDDSTFAELLSQVRDATVDGLTHQQLPFEKLIEDFAPDRTLAHAPLIQVQFAYGSLTPPTLDLPGITTCSQALFTSTAKLDLTLYADAQEGQDGQATRLSMEYSTDLFDAAWAHRFLGCMKTLLEHAAAAPDTRVADLPTGTGDLGRWGEDGSWELTPTAKVDRASPPAPEWSAVPSAAGRVEPRNPVEATLARIWGDLLDTKAPVGVRDNLFALGGHSLTATRFVARVGDAYGVKLPVYQVFVSPTIAELAEVIAAYPDFRVAEALPRHAELDALSDEDLDALSDEELDKLLRTALAERNRRRPIAGCADS